MTAGVDLERRLAAWFEDEAPARAPDRLLSVSLEIVAVTDQRGSIGRRARWAASRLTRRQRLIIVLAATLSLLVGGLVIGAWVVQQVPRPPALVVVRADGAFPEPVGLTVLAQEADGSTRVLGAWTPEALGASYADGAGVAMSPDGHLAVPVSTAAGTSEYRIVDLRDPSAPPRTPDAESMFGAWGPGDRFAMIVNGGGYVAYDAHTGVSSSVSAGAGPREIMFRPVWSRDGAGIHANGVVASSSGFGVIEVDGTVVPGAVPEFPTGIGPRRTDPDGARIQCVTGEDFGCEDGATISRLPDSGFETLYVDDRLDVRIADFSVTADGTGLWLLLETIDPGPRTMTFVHRSTDGTAREVASFAAGADDPDEGSYFPGGTFDGIAPDDSRIVIHLAGENGSPGTRWSIDPMTGERTPVDGAPAGWLDRTTLSAQRPAVERIAETPEAIRGDWVTTLPERVGAIPEGYHALLIRRSSGTLEAGFGQEVALTIGADGGDGVVVRQPRAAIGCAAGSSARYRWAIDAGGLRLQAVDDACDVRRRLLENRFEPVLPAGDTGPKPVPAGARLIASRFVVPFRLTAPAGGLLANSHGAASVTVGADPEGVVVTIVPVVSHAGDPCDRFSAGGSLPPGLDAAVTSVEGLADVGVTVERLRDVAIGDRSGPTFRLAKPAACERGLALFPREGEAVTVGDGAVVTLIEPVPGRVVAFLVAGTEAPDAAWLRELLGSIEFVD